MYESAPPLKETFQQPLVISQPIGQTPPAQSIGEQIAALDPVPVPLQLPFNLLVGAALAYHGYKRNNSIGWAIAWSFTGGILKYISVPIAIAQGFAKPKGK